VSLTLYSNQLTGSIPPWLGNLPNLMYLDLDTNQLEGSIPPELQNLSKLVDLYLDNNFLEGVFAEELAKLTNLQNLEILGLGGNRFSGPIPPEIGGFPNLWYLSLRESPFLTGSIPAEIGDLSNLVYLYLHDCQLGGGIPPEIGNLTSLWSLNLSSNRLNGEIPVELLNLASIPDETLNINWNALHSDDPAVIDFMNLTSGNWQSTQTVPPTNVSAEGLSGCGIEVSWDPVAYVEDPGRYGVYVGTSSGGSFTLYGETASKAYTSFVVGDLSPSSAYYFMVDTITDPHVNNSNTVISDLSLQVMGTTTSSGGGATSELSISDVTVNEGDTGSTYARFTVSQDVSSCDEVTFEYSTADGSATAGEDYVSSSDSLTIPSGATSVVIPVEILGDTALEWDETFTVTLSSPTNATIADGVGQGVIVDDDPIVSLPERDALIALYNSTNGSGWAGRTNWRNGSDTDFNDPGTECSWFGVTCEAGGDTVTQLYLPDNELLGPIPSSLGSLSGLEHLNLSQNQLSGNVPPELGNLSGLGYLNLSRNELSGNIPAGLGDLSNLRHLYLSDNQLSGEIPAEIGDLSILEFLDLQGNQLSGNIPPQLGNLSNLVYLYLYDNQLGGNIPPQIGNLSNLLALLLSDNQIGGNIPAELGSLTNLWALYLNNNQFTGNIPVEIQTLSGLMDLALSGNQLGGGIPAAIADLTNLEYLYLHDNGLTGNVPPELATLANLRELHLSENSLTGSIPSELGDLPALEILKLNDNQLNGNIPQELSGLSDLKGLYLYSNELSGSIPPELGGLSNLRDLYLWGNHLTGIIPPELGSLSNLETLTMRNNQLSGPIPPELGNLTSLTVLYLSSNMLAGEVPAEITNLVDLEDGTPQNGGTDLRWNSLFSHSPTVTAFLNQKQRQGDWWSTQTIAPENVSVDAVGDQSVSLSWDAIAYEADSGGYEVYFRPTGGGAWTSGGWTASKSESSFPVTGLSPGTSYDFSVMSFTNPHINNENLLTSYFSSIVSATTTTVGCVEPAIQLTWGSPIILSVQQSFDSYLWSTGETTSTIQITPPSLGWYSVTVTGPGACEESASIFVDPAIVFKDGFESGNTSVWSSSNP